MFNILPGQGLGSTGSKLLVFSLGYYWVEGGVPPITPVEVLEDTGGWAMPGYPDYDAAMLAIQRDDEEVLSVIANIITSGIL